MSRMMKKGFVMSVVAGALLIAYQLHPDYQGVIVISSIFGLSLTAR